MLPVSSLSPAASVCAGSILLSLTEGTGLEANAPFVIVDFPRDSDEDNFASHFCFFADGCGGGLSLSDPELVPDPVTVAESTDDLSSTGPAFLFRCQINKKIRSQIYQN